MYNEFPHAFKQVVMFLLASLVYHEPWLRQNLSSHHPLFSTFLFSSGKIEQYKRHVRITSTKLKPTGIPPHLSIATELVTVSERVNEYKTEILTQCKEMPKLLTDTMMSKFVINGGVPVTVDDMKQFMVKMIEEMKAISNNQQPVGATSVGDRNVVSDSNPLFNWYCWGEKMHMVPENWVLPTTNVKDIWNLWWFGHLDDKIQPYRRLKAMDFSKPKHVVQLTKTRGVMKAIEQMAREKNYIIAEKKIEGLSKQDNIRLFDLSYTDLLKKLFPVNEAGRIGEASISTLYDHINPKKRGRKRSREESNHE